MPSGTRATHTGLGNEQRSQHQLLETLVDFTIWGLEKGRKCQQAENGQEGEPQAENPGNVSQTVQKSQVWPHVLNEAIKRTKLTVENRERFQCGHTRKRDEKIQ